MRDGHRCWYRTAWERREPKGRKRTFLALPRRLEPDTVWEGSGKWREKDAGGCPQQSASFRNTAAQRPLLRDHVQKLARDRVWQHVAFRMERSRGAASTSLRAPLIPVGLQAGPLGYRRSAESKAGLARHFVGTWGMLCLPG